MRDMGARCRSATRPRYHRQDPDLYVFCETMMIVLYQRGLTHSARPFVTMVCVCQDDIGAGEIDFTQGWINCLP